MIARLALILFIATTVTTPVSQAADAPVANRFANTLQAAERFEVGATLVEKYGAKGRPLIMIPSLASGSWAWQDAARTFSADHVVYVLTLPGFDSRPPVPGQTTAAARASIIALIEQRKLASPVLIGHSLGGTLALAVASERPQLVGGVVSLDGLPVFPGTEEMPTAQRALMAEGLKARMGNMDQAIFVSQQREYMRGIGVIDMARGDELAGLSAKSDAGAVTQYMAETFEQDLRAQLPKISAPVLVISPYFETDARLQQLTEASKTAYYSAIMAGTPRLTVKSVSPARHFAMFDAPDKINALIAEFLKAN